MLRVLFSKHYIYITHEYITIGTVGECMAGTSHLITKLKDNDFDYSYRGTLYPNSKKNSSNRNKDIGGGSGGGGNNSNNNGRIIQIKGTTTRRTIVVIVVIRIIINTYDYDDKITMLIL